MRTSLPPVVDLERRLVFEAFLLLEYSWLLTSVDPSLSRSGSSSSSLSSSGSRYGFCNSLPTRDTNSVALVGSRILGSLLLCVVARLYHLSRTS